MSSMYLPRHFEESDAARLEMLIRQHPFGTLISVADGHPVVSHVPFVADDADLLCHLAKANPHSEVLRQGGDVLCIFQGPHAYVSPSWYESPGVPTWNYTAVHARGVADVIDERDQLAALVERFTRHFEAGFANPWEPEYSQGMLGAIVGVRIRVTQLEGKFKLSQNRSQADRDGVVRMLEAAGDDLSLGVAAMIRQNSTR